MRQHLVEIHRAHHGADIGHRQLDDRGIEIGDFVTRLGGIDHLEEREPVDRDGRVVLGDDVLLRDIDRLLHYVHLVPDAIEIGHDDIEARPQRAGIFAEALDGQVVALRHRLDAGE